MSGREVRFVYRFRFNDGELIEFEVRLDYATLANLRVPEEPLPDWTALGFHQCPNCPVESVARCPPAAHLAEVVESFREVRSFDRVEVEVDAPSRTYLKRTDVQTGVSAVFGLLMATSGCPILDHLRPMVDTHLPFMNEEESTFRILGSYLLSQHFRARRGAVPDWALTGLLELFDQVQTVNLAFLGRLRAIPMRDASPNAVVILNNLGALAGLSIARDKLDRLAAIHALADGGTS